MKLQHLKHNVNLKINKWKLPELFWDRNIIENNPLTSVQARVAAIILISSTVKLAAWLDGQWEIGHKCSYDPIWITEINLDYGTDKQSYHDFVLCDYSSIP